MNDKPFKFLLQTPVIIELESGHIIEGIIDRYTENFIKLRNSTDHETGASVHYTRLYRTQIKNIRTLEENAVTDAKAATRQTEENNPATINTSTCSIAEDWGASKTILIPKNEYLRLKNLLKTFVYIGMIDSRYYDAVSILKNCETIGLCGFLNGVHNLSVLTLSSWDQVYVFDIYEINEGIPGELKEMLEMPSIQKVIHDGRHLVISLQKFYKIRVQNLFDTQVADFKIRMRQESEMSEFRVRNINEMLSNYFNFPDDIHKHEIISWKYRPLSADYRRYAAESAAYVITLKNTLERILLKDYYKSVCKYTTTTDDLTALDLSALFARKVVNRIEL